MDRLAHAVILSWGWRRRGIAFGAGALSALAMPPFFIFPILWITFPVFVWLIDGAVEKSPGGRVSRLGPAFSAGWWFGFGYFLAGLWWIGAAFLVDLDDFGWLMPFVVVGLPAALALFWGFGAALAQLFWSEDWRRVFALALGLGAAEWLRGHILSGFPWNSIGYALTAGEILMQSAALLGLYALNVVAVVVFAAPAALAPAARGERRPLALPVSALVGLAALGLYGAFRLYEADAASASAVNIRIVQPALTQLQKWQPENKDEALSLYFRLSNPEGAPLQSGTVLVWPESAFPFPLTQEPGTLAAIAELLPEGTALVTGAYREEPRSGGASQFYNSIYVIGDDGTILDAYDKVHLVPLGEYVPGGDLLRRYGLRQLAERGFVPGPHRRPLALPMGPDLLPLICYEIIFPGEALGEGERPDFLLNVTNDGWFGRTTGPYQHFHQARVRSVEEGLPLVRAANTGVSAIVDAYGRSIAQSRLGETAMIEAALPAATVPPFYAQWRDALAALSLAVCMLTALTKNLYRASAV
ncbi:MAG: apolipoprotein N-acyltransferase [Propylenella sp.]